MYTQDVDRCITDHSTWNTLRLSEVGPNRIGTQNPFLLSLFLYNSKVEKEKNIFCIFYDVSPEMCFVTIDFNWKVYIARRDVWTTPKASTKIRKRRRRRDDMSPLLLV